MKSRVRTENMLEVLHAVESKLPTLIEDVRGWESLFVDYHPPFVERVYRQYGNYRIYLHCIHSCEAGEALFHPHPWPSAMRIVSGVYEMAIGYGEGDTPPPVAATIILPPESEYEMTHPDAWHYVRPVGKSAFSVMVTGKPWDRPSPKSEKPLSPLFKDRKDEILRYFKAHYLEYTT